MPAAGDIAILFQTIVGAWPFEFIDRRPIGPRRLRKARRKLATKGVCARRSFFPIGRRQTRYTRGQRRRLFPTHIFRVVISFGRTQRVCAIEITAAPGAVNSLGQTLVKLTAPGVPDIYQGTEYWDQSLVDLDNRTAVDFAVRKSTLGSRDVTNWCDGKNQNKHTCSAYSCSAKEISTSLCRRKLYSISCFGALQNQLIGFARSLPDIAVIVLICRFNARFASGSGSLSIPAAACKYTSINVPQDFCVKHTATQYHRTAT